MQEGITTRDRIAMLIYSMVDAVLFGIGLVVVLNVRCLRLICGSAFPSSC